MASNDVNKSQIKAFINSTYNDRDNMRKTKASAASIIAKYPKIMDYQGEMVRYLFTF
jgi:hypothetical protein